MSDVTRASAVGLVTDERHGARRLSPPPGVVPDLTPAETRETPEDRAERQAVATAHRERRYYKRLPKRYAEASYADLSAEQDPEGKVSEWLDRGHQTLLLVSPEPGLGKTHAAYAVGTAAVRAGLWVEAWSTIDLLSAMRREMQTNGEPAVLDDTIGCDLLILDDLGKESSTVWAQEQVHHIFNVRLAEQRRTVVTTNLTSALVGERYGFALLDRVLDDAVIAKVTGESRREVARW